MSSFPIPIPFTPIVGPATLNDGVQYRAGRMDKQGNMVNADSLGLFTEQNYRGNLFFACNTASQALSLNSTTCTGLAITNPANSGKTLALIQLNVSLQTAPAGISTLILTGSNTTVPSAHGTPLVVNQGYFGKTATSVALVDSACTMPTLTIFRGIGGGPVATGSVTSSQIVDNINGQILLGPGTCLSLQALVTAISVIASISWIEIPV